MAQHLIDLASDDPTKKPQYGCPIPLNEFRDLRYISKNPAAVAAKLEGADPDHPSLPTLSALYEPATEYQDHEKVNIKMSVDIFGPSTMENNPDHYPASYSWL